MPTTVICLMICFLALSGPAVAQLNDAAITIPSSIEIYKGGWSQLRDTEEMREFLFATIEAMGMTAVLAFHPRNISRRRTSSDWEVPRAMFLYALVGLAVGFLVVHHGVLIGFAVFGIGGLYRFRMETLGTSDAAYMMLVSLIGLSVGLNLPVMALLLTIGAAVVVSVFSRKTHLVLEVKFENSSDYLTTMDNLRKALTTSGFVIHAITKSKFKPIAEIMLSSNVPNIREKLIQTMSKFLNRPESGIDDWHVD